MPAAPDLRRGWAFPVVAVLVGLWAAFANLYRLGTAQILSDEPAYALAAWRYVHLDVLHAGEPGGPDTARSNLEHPPLAKLLFGLAQLVFGRQSIPADRAVAGLCTVALGVVLAVWVGRAAGRWTGLLAGAFATLLPQRVNEADGRFSRFGFLEPVAALLVVVALAVGWAWWRASGRRSWWLALALGAAVGLASSAKENAFLGLVAGTVLVVATAGRAWPTRALQALTAAAVSAVTLLAVYLPVGHPVMRIQYMLDFQSSRGLRAHGVTFAGRYALHPPWWTHLWFAGHGMTAVVTAALVLLAAIALVVRRDALVAWCVAALAVPFVVHSFLVPIKLPYYYTLWQAPFLVLAALGAASLTRRGLVTGAVAAAVLAGPATGALAETRRVATLEPVGLKVLTQVQAEHGLDGLVVVGGTYRYEWLESPARARFRPEPVLEQLPQVDTVVLSRPRCNIVVSPLVRAFVAANEGALRRVHRDRRIDVYEVTAPLVLPSDAAVALQPPLDPAALC